MENLEQILATRIPRKECLPQRRISQEQLVPPLLPLSQSCATRGVGRCPPVYQQYLEPPAVPQARPQIVLPPPPQLLLRRPAFVKNNASVRSSSVGAGRRASLPQDSATLPTPVPATSRASLLGNLATRAKEMLGIGQKLEESKPPSKEVSADHQGSEASPGRHTQGHQVRGILLPEIPANRFVRPATNQLPTRLSPLQRFTKMALPPCPQPAPPLLSPRLRRRAQVDGVASSRSDVGHGVPLGTGVAYDTLLVLSQKPQPAPTPVHPCASPPVELPGCHKMSRTVSAHTNCPRCERHLVGDRLVIVKPEKIKIPPPTPPDINCVRRHHPASTTASSVEFSDESDADVLLKLHSVVAQLKGLAARTAKLGVEEIEAAILSLGRAVEKLESSQTGVTQSDNDMKHLTTTTTPAHSYIGETWFEAARSDLLDNIPDDPELFALSPDRTSREETVMPSLTPKIPSHAIVCDGVLEEQLELLTRTQLDFDALWFTNKDRETLVHASRFWDARDELEVIQSGGQGTVYGGVYDDIEVAIKIASPEHLARPDYRETIFAKAIQEWYLLSQCDHPGIVRLIGSLRVAENEVWLVTQRVYGPDLHTLKYVYKCPIEVPHAIRMCAQLAGTLHYLHSGKTKDGRPMVHGDIKPENIIINSDWSIQLCDFGDAECFTGPRVFRRRGVTWLYAPFEILKSDPSQEAEEYPPPTDKSDIWAAGCVFHEFLGGLNPFRPLTLEDAPNKVQTALQTAAAEGRLIPQILEILPDGFKRLIHECLSPEPANRPTAEELAIFWEKVLTQWSQHLLN